MLYDGAIAALLGAADAIEAHEIEKKCHYLNRALAIVIQLEATLDFEHGGEVAKNLGWFYAHARTQAMKANVEDSAEILRSLIEHFTTLRDAWREGERRLATHSPSLPAMDAGARNDWSGAETVGLSIVD
jgi:flagellar protein FliS